MAQDVLAEAVQHHEAGRLKKAEKLYRGVLKANPKNSVALRAAFVYVWNRNRYYYSLMELLAHSEKNCVFSSPHIISLYFRTIWECQKHLVTKYSVLPAAGEFFWSFF